MSDPFNSVQEGFERRIALRRRMLRHLGLDFADDEAARLYPDLRSTVLACIDCGTPEACQGWLDEGRQAVPAFCQGREALSRLKAAWEHTGETRSAPPETPVRKHSVND